MKITIAPSILQGTPDISAMLQAFYSRSHLPIQERLDDLSDGTQDIDQIRASLKKYLIQYGHESIGDCGNILVFVENVTMLTAKAIQDCQLYSGQETSSRYIDFTEKGAMLIQQVEELDHLKPVIDSGEYRVNDVVYLIDLYRQAYDRLYSEFLDHGMEPAAAKVKAFDIARGVLPAGTPTQFSAYLSIRTWRGILAACQSHPEAVVRLEAGLIHDTLREAYPDLFTDLPKVNHAWLGVAEPTTLSMAGAAMRGTPCVQGDWSSALDFLRSHPDMPLSDLRLYGSRVTELFIDYGSYRDLQRHRRAYIKPLHSLPHVESFYGEYLPSDITRTVGDYLSEVHTKDRFMAPHYPLGTQIKFRIVLDLEQLVYMLDLRSKPHVHPTARGTMQDMFMRMVNQYERETYSDFWVNYLHFSTETDHDRRAKQTILKVGEDGDAAGDENYALPAGGQ